MLVEVGPEADPKYHLENLTLDAGINCGCNTVVGKVSVSGDSFSKFTALLMLLLTIFIAVRETEKRA